MNSSILKWPTVEQVRRAAAEWAAAEAKRRPGVVRVGYFGSYARGDAGVGSDLDLVAVVETAAESFARRGLAWDLLPLPVPAQILVYTAVEWERMRAEAGRFITTLDREAVWLAP